MTSTDTIAIHWRYHNEVINQGDLNLVDAIFTPTYVDHPSGGPDIQGPAGHTSPPVGAAVGTTS
jgi:hypothetical protein